MARDAVVARLDETKPILVKFDFFKHKRVDIFQASFTEHFVDDDYDYVTIWSENNNNKSMEITGLWLIFL